MGFTGKKFESSVKPVKIIGSEGALQYPANLLVIASPFQFLRGSPNGKIIDDDLTLFERALRYPAQFTQLEITQSLHTDPDANSKDREN